MRYGNFKIDKNWRETVIKEMVDTFNRLVQSLIVFAIIMGAVIINNSTPNAFYFEEEIIELSPLVKWFICGVLSFTTTAILLGPILALLDMRNAIRSIDEKMPMDHQVEPEEGKPDTAASDAAKQPDATAKSDVEHPET